MANYGIKVTKPGKAVTSTDEEDYIIWSKYETSKVIVWGTASYTFASDVTSFTIEIDHNIGQSNLCWWSFDCSGTNALWVGAGYTWIDYMASGSDGLLRTMYYDTEANKLYIQYREYTYGSGYAYDPTGEAWTYKYYLYTDEVFQ